MAGPAGILYQFKKMLYAKLTNLPLAGAEEGILVPCYDAGAVPDEAGFPYTVLVNISEDQYDTLGIEGSRVVAQIHLWSDYNGSQQVLWMYDSAKDLLHFLPQTVTGYTWIWGECRFIGAQTMTDGIHTRGIMEYTAHLMEA